MNHVINIYIALHMQYVTEGKKICRMCYFLVTRNCSCEIWREIRGLRLATILRRYILIQLLRMLYIDDVQIICGAASLFKQKIL